MTVFVNSKVYVGDIGTVFELEILDQDDVVVDLSAASTLQGKFVKPDATVVAKTFVLSSDGTDGKMQYVTTTGDIDQAGEWKLQGYLVLGGWSGHTTEYDFDVYTPNTVA